MWSKRVHTVKILKENGNTRESKNSSWTVLSHQCVFPFLPAVFAFHLVSRVPVFRDLIDKKRLNLLHYKLDRNKTFGAKGLFRRCQKVSHPVLIDGVHLLSSLKKLPLSTLLKSTPYSHLHIIKRQTESLHCIWARCKVVSVQQLPLNPYGKSATSSCGNWNIPNGEDTIKICCLFFIPKREKADTLSSLIFQVFERVCTSLIKPT